MERSDVTKPDQPFRVVTKACEVQLIQQVNRSVTTTLHKMALISSSSMAA
mgnify:CR=1 FL=1